MREKGTGGTSVDPETLRALAATRARDVALAEEPEQMLRALARYLEVQPGNDVAWADKAGLLIALRRFDEGMEACRQALAINPRQMSARFHLGTACTKLGRLDEAEDLFREILSVEPDRMEARLALAECLLGRRRLEAAREVLAEVIQQDPASLKAHQLMGQSLYEQGRWSEFRLELDRFERHAPLSDYLEFERGFENLLRGIMPLGWRQWEARLRVPGCVGPERDFKEPRWDGGLFGGKTLLVHYEQGLGDTMMLARFLPQVKARGGTVVLLAQPELAGLMTTCRGVDLIVPQGGLLPPFDLQVSLYSLPAVLQVDLASLPGEVPYLGVPRQVPNRDRIDERLTASEGRLRIALAWTGNPTHRRDAERSIPVGLLERLAVLPGVAWHGFQVGSREEPALPDYVPMAPLLDSFADTAYALERMDLVISVDTALAHLAGALGVPVFLLVTHAPDFRWMLDREDSPWYPTMRIFRQPRQYDWGPVLDGIVQAFAEEE